MDDFLGFEQEQTIEHLLCEASDDFQREAFEGVGFDELVEIHIQKLGGDAKMTAEVETLYKVDHAVLVLGVLHLVSLKLCVERMFQLTHSRSFCRMLTSTKAC